MPMASGLRWKKRFIEVYISKYAPYSLSVPLTIKIYKDAKLAVAVLVHELAHNIVFQNRDSINYKRLFDDFRHEDLTTKYHIIEGAILYRLNKSIFSDGSGGFFIYDKWESPKSDQAYRKAMAIVIREGAENILKRYISKQ
jgi:hypothetical protein